MVLFGSGYDTRALRYRKHPEAAFYEVDLPEVVQGKAELYEKYLRENDDGYDKEVTSRFLGKGERTPSASFARHIVPHTHAFLTPAPRP